MQGATLLFDMVLFDFVSSRRDGGCTLASSRQGVALFFFFRKYGNSSVQLYSVQYCTVRVQCRIT